jgi:hypothetical protein
MVNITCTISKINVEVASTLGFKFPAGGLHTARIDWFKISEVRIVRKGEV